MSTFGNKKCQRQSTSHLSPRAGCQNANNSPFASSSPPSSSSSQSPSPPRRRDAIRDAAVGFVNAIRKTGRSTTAVPQFRGVRHREELNKFVSEIRPTRCTKKIWLGTYDTAGEAARAFDIGNLCCNKNLPLNFADSPMMMSRLPRISPELSPEHCRSAIANLAKECARLHKSEANLPGNSYLYASEAIATPQAPFNFQAAMAQSGQYGNQFDARSDSISFDQYGQVQQVCPPQELHFDSRIQNYATGSRSEIYFEQLPEQVCPVTEVATAVPMTKRDGVGSRSWEFDIYRKIPSNASLPEPDLPVLTEAPLDAIDNHMYEDNLYQDQVQVQLPIDNHMFGEIFYDHTGW